MIYLFYVNTMINTQLIYYFIDLVDAFIRYKTFEPSHNSVWKFARRDSREIRVTTKINLDHVTSPPLGCNTIIPSHVLGFVELSRCSHFPRLWVMKGYTWYISLSLSWQFVHSPLKNCWKRNCLFFSYHSWLNINIFHRIIANLNFWETSSYF